MSKKEKPLPKPPQTPFSRKRGFEQSEERESLMADEMAKAAAEGNLEKFLQAELPDSKYARDLAKMMMGMTGLFTPDNTSIQPENTAGKTSGKENLASDEQGSPPGTPPDDVLRATKTGDMKGLMELLAREHKKRTAGSGEISAEELTSPSSENPTIEKDIIDQLIKISSDNDLPAEWLFFRALKRYVEEYKKTGNL
jgi:hypothetical protein